MKSTSGGKKINSNKEVKAMIEALNEISDQLCLSINGNFDIKIFKNYENEHVQKLVMLTNFLLDSSRRAVDKEKQKSVYSKKLMLFIQNIVRALEANEKIESLLLNLLTTICNTLNFSIGHFYEYNPKLKRLTSSNLWFLEHKSKYRAFQELTKKTDFSIGEGLPGLAWKHNKLITCDVFYKKKNFPRAVKLTKLKLSGAFAIPIFYQGGILGVIECYRNEALSLLTEDEMWLISQVSQISTDLFLFNKKNQLHELILNATAEGIYGLDLLGKTTFINPAACKMLGYQVDDLIGQSMHQIIHYKHGDGSRYSLV